jgi:hypothetical protein
MNPGSFVVSTGAERSEAQWRDLLSAISSFIAERRSLHSGLSALGRDDGDSI